MQNDIIIRLKNDLFTDADGSLWEDEQNKVVQGYEVLEHRVPDEAQNRHNELFINGCNADAQYNNSKIFVKDNLYAVYKSDASAETATKSILDLEVLFEIL